MYATQFGHVDLVELLLELGHEEEVISVVSNRYLNTGVDG